MAEAPDAPNLADAAAAWRGAYLHLPFCARVCPYCDFAVVAGRGDLMDRYLDAVEAEIRRDEPTDPIDALFIGGGTPSMVPPSRLGRLVEAVDDVHGLSPGAEVTMEANPEDLTARLATEVALAGVDRLSLGVQSTDPRVLMALGRRHDARQVGSAVWAAERAGLRSVSVDLIFGHPVESTASWRRTLEEVVVLEPDHVSTYALTVERGTPLSRAVSAGAPAPDPDVQADRWEVAVDVLGAAGFTRYEVSNHGRPGHACRYNLVAWAGGDYHAWGLGAHGHLKGVRFRNVRSLDAYLERMESGGSPRAGEERLDGWDREVERVFLGLRRAAGVALGRAGEAYLASAAGRSALSAGVVERRGDRLVVARPLLTDAVAREVLGTPEPAGSDA